MAAKELTRASNPLRPVTAASSGTLTLDGERACTCTPTMAQADRIWGALVTTPTSPPRWVRSGVSLGVYGAHNPRPHRR